MHREVLLGCLPYLGATGASVLVLRLLICLSGARLELSRLVHLHRDQRGGVQSLSFVLTLPPFIMILMFIVQLSQLTIAKIVVEYAAFAAARSAIVWIPANEATDREWANQIGTNRVFLRQVGEENNTNYAIYEIAPGTAKYDKIHLAAAMACLPICPSRDAGVGREDPGNGALPSLLKAYRAVAPSSIENPRISSRIDHKLRYALASTRVRIEVRHKDEIGRTVTEAPLARHDIGPYRDEFAPNEIGWQDQVWVTVTHDFALLPGPGRLLARRAEPPVRYSDDQRPIGGAAPRDRVAEHIGRMGNVLVYPISATVRLQNEGQKSVLPYYQNLGGMMGPVEEQAGGSSDEGLEDQQIEPAVDDRQRSDFVVP